MRPITAKIERSDSVCTNRDHMYTDEIIYEARQNNNLQKDIDTVDFEIE